METNFKRIIILWKPVLSAKYRAAIYFNVNYSTATGHFKSQFNKRVAVIYCSQEEKIKDEKILNIILNS